MTTASGYFILSVRPVGEEKFSELESGRTAQRLKYDDASREKAGRREGVLELVKAVAGRWQANYSRFADAGFRIEEVDADGEITLISGPKNDNSSNYRKVRDKLTKVGAVYNRAAKTASREDMIEWLFAHADVCCDEAGLLPAWVSLSIGERVELCREVVAGYYTPAVRA